MWADPLRVLTSRNATPPGVPPFPMRSGPLLGSPAEIIVCLPHSGPGTLPGGLSGGLCGCRAWGRRLRTPTCRRGHRQYLRSGPPYDFPRYRSKVHEVTQAFAAVSREVLAVEAELAGPRAQPLLASHVRSLQQLEQTRLATVRPRPRPRPRPPTPSRASLALALVHFAPLGRGAAFWTPQSRPQSPRPHLFLPISIFH